MSTNQPKIMTEEARYGVRLNYIIFPIDFRELRRALAKNGYELSSVAELPPLPTRFRFGGEIARKGQTTVRAESDSGEIEVVDRSLQEAYSSFEGLANVVNSELGISLHNNVKFYWIAVHFRIATGKLPRDEIAKVENKEYISQCSQIMGEDLSSFAIRLGSKNATPNQESWLDIAIEPEITNEKLYHVGAVFRNPNKSNTETFVKNLENNLLKLISLIEAE